MSPDRPALEQIRKEAAELKDEFNSSSSPYAARIRRIVVEFDAFSEKYRTLWEELAKELPQNPPGNVNFEAVDNRIVDFWLALQAIVTQYKYPPYRSKVEEGMAFLEDLAKSKPDLFPPTQANPDVLIFIKEKDVNIARKYPYTNTFFIGISELSANFANNPRKVADWKPVAHELGHYIYWNSRFKTTTDWQFAEIDQEPVFTEDIEAALENSAGIRSSAKSLNEALTALMISWSEEIFADLVGTHLLGREYAESAQALFIGQQKEEDVIRFTDDIEHPIPYLRPFVCAEGLKLVESPKNRFWSMFKDKIKNLFDTNFETSQALSVGLFSTDDSNESGFENLTLDIPTMQKGIKVVVPILYDRLQKREVLIGRRVGIEHIKNKIGDEFVDFYVDISDVLERGDKKGFARKARKTAKRLIERIFRK